MTRIELYIVILHRAYACTESAMIGSSPLVSLGELHDGSKLDAVDFVEPNTL